MDGRVLIVEDEQSVASGLQVLLKQEGLHTEWVPTGEQALTAARQHPWDLILLDVRLPGIDGFEVCRQLRTDKLTVPIVFLTGCADEISHVLALQGVGGDDYILKPPLPRVLVARVIKHIQRHRELNGAAQKPTMPQVLAFGALEVDLTMCEVRINKQAVVLTAKEFELLKHMALHPGQMFTRTQLLEAVWKEEALCNYDDTVTVHISRLRDKLRSMDPNTPYIETKKGLGYRFRKG